MAGGLGGLGGFDFGNVLGALGQSLLTSPRENPFQGLPQALQNNAQQREHQAALLAMSTVAEKLGVPKELAASPQAMKLFIDHINQTKLNQLRQQAAAGGSFMPPGDDATSQPALSIPGRTGSLDGPGGLGGAAPSFAAGGGAAPRTMTLPGGPSGSRVERGRAVFNGLVERGLSPIAAASVTGNLDHESGGFNTKAMGDQGTAFGLAQWRLDRVNALKRLAAEQGKPWTDLNVQLDHLVNELKGPYRGTLTALNSASSPQEGALAFMRGFERPSAKELVRSAPPRVNSAANAFKLYAGGGRGGPSQAPAGDAPLPPPRPYQVASTNPNAMAVPSAAMQRVTDEAVAKGVGQGGAGAGQSGAPLNQVAASTKTLTTPIQTTLPPTPTTPPPSGTGDTKTKAWARAEFQRGMNLLAASNGDPVLMKQAEIIMQRAAKYGDPSDTARRVSEAGLTGTPVGRAIIGGLPQGVIEKLTEQQVPGYESPGTLEQKKFRSSEEERAYQHSKGERVFQSAEEERQYRRQYDERRLANEIANQTLTHNRAEAARRQQRDIATESHAIQQQTEAERLGRGLTGQNAPQVRAGLEAKTEQAAAEAGARDLAAARTRFGAEATGGAQAAEGLLTSVNKAEQHLDMVVKLGGYGLFNAIPGSRSLNALIPDIPGLKPGHTAEIERQQFDQAIAGLGAAKAAAVNKAQGGGNMSATEQVLARMDLPTLTAAAPKVAKEAFQKLREDIARAQALDKRFGIFQGEQQTPQAREAPAAPASAAPAPSKDGWIDLGNGVRVRRK